MVCLLPLQAAYEGDAEVVEPALGVAANMTLRQPDTVTAIAAVRKPIYLLYRYHDHLRTYAGSDIHPKTESRVARLLMLAVSKHRMAAHHGLKVGYL